MNEMTGFNPEQAKNDIMNFYGNGQTAKMALVHAFEDLYSDLKEEWASDKAVEFDNKHRSTINETISTFRNSINKICQNACNAFDEIASKQGVPGCGLASILDSASDSTFEYQFAVIYYNKNGVVGMNIEAVNNTLEVFDSKIAAFVELVDNLPLNIAFFDPDGSQAKAYKSLIDNSKSKVLEEIEAIKNDIKTAIVTEQNNILLAKQQATDTLA